MQAMADQLPQAKSAILELIEDATVSKNIKVRLEQVVKILEDDAEISVRVNRVLNELDDLSNDANLQPYIRTQVWNIVSLLEKV
ncbi:MAG TPA: UPF0147 family protein [Candidatus Nanoarchaeia archaeon]|nr:UPF0147 family protein [Candidatus Nanoarchaeia archaeon]